MWANAEGFPMVARAGIATMYAARYEITQALCMIATSTIETDKNRLELLVSLHNAMGGRAIPHNGIPTTQELHGTLTGLAITTNIQRNKAQHIKVIVSIGKAKWWNDNVSPFTIL
jgi:hypothetical protein